MEPLPGTELRSIAERQFGTRLVPLGFDLANGQWVRSAKGSIREVVNLYRLKSQALVPCWGFSLDFVPHLGSGESIKWHRTSKTALLDLSYDPLDYTTDVREWTVPGFGDQAEVHARAGQVADQTLSMAESLFKRVKAIGDLPSVFEEMRAKPFVRFGFDNYVRNSLAYAFTLAQLDRTHEARQWLAKYVKAADLREETGPALEALLEQALHHRVPSS